jgi:hypothetical protein
MKQIELLYAEWKEEATKVIGIMLSKTAEKVASNLAAAICTVCVAKD